MTSNKAQPNRPDLLALFRTEGQTFTTSGGGKNPQWLERSKFSPLKGINDSLIDGFKNRINLSYILTHTHIFKRVPKSSCLKDGTQNQVVPFRLSWVPMQKPLHSSNASHAPGQTRLSKCVGCWRRNCSCSSRFSQPALWFLFNLNSSNEEISLSRFGPWTFFSWKTSCRFG